MPQKNKSRVPQGVRIGLLVAAVVGLATGIMAWSQVQRERRIDEEDLDRRAHMMAHNMSWAVRHALTLTDSEAAVALGDRLTGYRRVLGCAVFRPDGRMIASGQGVTEYSQDLKPRVDKAIRTGAEVSESVRLRDSLVHILAYCIKDINDSVLGVLVVVQDVSYLEQRATARLVQFGFWVLLVTLMLVALVTGATWAAYDRPLGSLAEWMRRLRTENVPEAPPRGLPTSLLVSESSRLAASFRAARSAGWRESREMVREHNVWTRDRLRAHAIDCLQGRQLIVVSNREPYMHQYRDGVPQMIVPAGGLVTALDPVLRACSGLWVAHGGGDADRQMADEHGRLTVPPNDPRYTLRRVWLTREEEQGYYYGLSNEGLWPLCHLAHERPVFRASDWEQYQRANKRFADAVLEEIGMGDATVLVQDYQLALVPEILKAARPDIQVGIFWHIPWPNPEAFRICPWRTEILHGMLGADVIGFHLQQYCNNFLDTVDRMVEARLDWDHFAAELRGHSALVRPFPISVESWSERSVPSGDELAKQIASLREHYKLGDTQIVVGVERIDYTKGLRERLRAFDRFLTKYPEHREKMTFVILGAPSRTHLRRYRDLGADLESMSDEINWKHQTENWKPLRFLAAHHDASTVHAFLQMSSICVVSPLHDGMNLVAKEYVAAKADSDGVLILSEFAGAARELAEALLINPYDTEQFADAINEAVLMSTEERQARMKNMRTLVEEYNVYHWAASFLTCLTSTHARPPRNSGHVMPAGPVVTQDASPVVPQGTVKQGT